MKKFNRGIIALLFATLLCSCGTESGNEDKGSEEDIQEVSGKEASDYYKKIRERVIELGSNDNLKISLTGNYKLGSDVNIQNISGFVDGDFESVSGSVLGEKITENYYIDRMINNDHLYNSIYRSVLDSENKTVLVEIYKRSQEKKQCCALPEKLDEILNKSNLLGYAMRSITSYNLWFTDPQTELISEMFEINGERIQFDVTDRMKYSYIKDEDLTFTISSDLNLIGPISIVSPDAAVRYAYWQNVVNGPKGNYSKKITLDKNTLAVKKIEVSYKGIDPKLLPNAHTEFSFTFERYENSDQNYKNEFKSNCESYFM